jgi:catechol 2,3-dioxygenase-like lactoylglutathione lyase family enzyme
MQKTMSSIATAQAVCVLACRDLQKERDFFQDKLGLHVDVPQGLPNYAVVRAGGGTWMLCYERHHQPPCEAAAMTFVVDDLRQAMHELRGKGVRFEEYDEPGLKTQDGIAVQGDSQAAWFKDPAGNILSITQLGPGTSAEVRSVVGGASGD